jgi:hypothetical protein
MRNEVLTGHVQYPAAILPFGTADEELDAPFFKSNVTYEPACMSLLLFILLLSPFSASFFPEHIASSLRLLTLFHVPFHSLLPTELTAAHRRPQGCPRLACAHPAHGQAAHG